MSRTAHFSSARHGESVSRQTTIGLVRELGAAEALIISSMPRGGLQIVQPNRVTEALVKAYGRELHTLDRSSWTAIAHGKPAAAGGNDPYVRALAEFGYAYAASAPIADPVFDGYAGVVQVLRTAEQGPFSDADLKKLAELAGELELPAAAGRSSRHAGGKTDAADFVWRKRPAIRQWVLNLDGKPVAFSQSFRELDPQLQEQVVEEIRKHQANRNGDELSSRRVSLPDSEGDFWTFNFVSFAHYPALGSGGAVFVCLQPEFPEWSTLRPQDFQADPELSRLVPALKFMQQEFRRGPTLGEISLTVSLSPFHFHRRFSELLGLTPKHFLLECQIHDAKHELLAGNKSLAKIAADCGFAHQSHFTSRFKQTTGLTPTRWRRMARNRAQGEQGSA